MATLSKYRKRIDSSFGSCKSRKFNRHNTTMTDNKYAGNTKTILLFDHQIADGTCGVTRIVPYQLLVATPIFVPMLFESQVVIDAWKYIDYARNIVRL